MLLRNPVGFFVPWKRADVFIKWMRLQEKMRVAEAGENGKTDRFRAGRFYLEITIFGCQRSQPRRVSENWPPESEVQLSWVGVTSAQLTLDWVLRKCEVMLISTSRSETEV